MVENHPGVLALFPALIGALAGDVGAAARAQWPLGWRACNGIHAGLAFYRWKEVTPEGGKAGKRPVVWTRKGFFGKAWHN